MKLVVAIIQDEDSNILIDRLTEEEYRVTKLATTGGFLKSGNTTLIIGVAKEKVQNVVNIIKDECSTRKQVVTSPTPTAGTTGVFVPYPIEVTVGGATIFVVDVDQFMKF